MNDDFESLFEIPQESITLCTTEPVNLTINVNSTSMNSLSPKRSAMKLYSMLKVSLDTEVWGYFVEAMLLDPEVFNNLIKGMKK